MGYSRQKINSRKQNGAVEQNLRTLEVKMKASLVTISMTKICWTRSTFSMDGWSKMP